MLPGILLLDLIAGGCLSNWLVCLGGAWHPGGWCLQVVWFRLAQVQLPAPTRPTGKTTCWPGYGLWLKQKHDITEGDVQSTCLLFVPIHECLIVKCAVIQDSLSRETNYYLKLTVHIYRSSMDPPIPDTYLVGCIVKYFLCKFKQYKLSQCDIGPCF